MKIIEIATLENGGHRNQFSSVDIPVPEGWVIIPDDIEIPDTFPFVTFHYRSGKVIDMSPGTMPPPPPEPEPERDVWDEIAEAIRNGVNSVD